MKMVGATGLGGLWALEWAWHIQFRFAACIPPFPFGPKLSNGYLIVEVLDYSSSFFIPVTGI